MLRLALALSLLLGLNARAATSVKSLTDCVDDQFASGDPKWDKTYNCISRLKVTSREAYNREIRKLPEVYRSLGQFGPGRSGARKQFLNFLDVLILDGEAALVFELVPKIYHPDKDFEFISLLIHIAFYSNQIPPFIAYFDAHTDDFKGLDARALGSVLPLYCDAEKLLAQTKNCVDKVRRFNLNRDFGAMALIGDGLVYMGRADEATHMVDDLFKVGPQCRYIKGWLPILFMTRYYRAQKKPDLAAPCTKRIMECQGIGNCAFTYHIETAKLLRKKHLADSDNEIKLALVSMQKDREYKLLELEASFQQLQNAAITRDAAKYASARSAFIAKLGVLPYANMRKLLGKMDQWVAKGVWPPNPTNIEEIEFADAIGK